MSSYVLCVCAQKQGSCFLASSFIEDTVTPFCQPKEVRRSEGRTRQESRHNAAFKQDLFLTTWTDTKWSLSYWSTLHSDCRLTRLTEYVIRELRTGIRCSHSCVWQLRASLWDTRTAMGQNRRRLRGKRIKKNNNFNLKFPATTTLSEEKKLSSEAEREGFVEMLCLWGTEAQEKGEANTNGKESGSQQKENKILYGEKRESCQNASSSPSE